MQDKLEQIVQKMNSTYKLLRTWQLEGGISAQVTGFEILLPDGQTKKLLLRRHGDTDYNSNPQIARQEFRLLRFLTAEAIPVAKPYYLDLTDELLGRPYLVLEYVEGHTQFEPENLEDFLLQFATNLAKIHSINPSKLSLQHKRDDIYRANFIEPAAHPDEVLQESLIRQTLAKACPLTQVNPSVLLHGDYWLGNILWKATDVVHDRTHKVMSSQKSVTKRDRHLIKTEEKLVAIIDWEDAVLGDPLADLANSRLELLWALGEVAMLEYTNQYQAIMHHLNYDNLPYWDLWAALRPIAQFSDWAKDEATRQLWRERHLWFSTQALSEI